MNRAISRPISRAISRGISETIGGEAWTPAELFQASEAGGWYDPSDLSTLWQDAAGTTPVTADGDPVGKMEDKSGNGNHMTQSVLAERPTYKTAGGLHYLDLTTAAVGMDYTFTPPATLTQSLGYDTNGDTAGLVFGRKAASTYFAGVFASGSSSTALADTVSGYSFVSLHVDGTVFSGTTRGDIYTDINGKKVDIFEYGTDAASRTFNFGNWNNGDATNSLTGHLYAHVLSEGSLSTGNRGEMETYIAGKSGVTL